MYIYNLFPLHFHLSYSVDGGIDRFAAKSAIGIISVRFFMRMILTETFHRIFMLGYSDGKHLHDDFA